MSTTQRELLASQTNAENPDNSTSSEHLIEKEQIPKTPFWVVGNKEKGYFLTYGKWKITDNFQSMEEAKTALHEEQWHIMTILAGIIADELLQKTRKQEMNKITDILKKEGHNIIQP